MGDARRVHWGATLFSGSSLTAEGLSTSTVNDALMLCADGAGLRAVAVRAALTQLLMEIRRGNHALEALFS